MTDTPQSLDRQSERGSALVMVLLLLLMMSALAAALGTSGQTETFIARNQNSAAIAHGAAEAGLAHGSDLVIDYIYNFSTNGFADAAAAIAALLSGPNDGARISLESRAGMPAGIELDEAVQVGNTQWTYTAWLLDDEDAAGAFPENGDPYADANERLLVRARGAGPDNTVVELEAVLGPINFPSIVTNGDLEIFGGVQVTGAGAGVHSNGDLTKTGVSGNLEGSLTTSGSYTGPSIGVQAGAREVPVPRIRASDYRNRANYVLSSTQVSGDYVGTISNAAGVVQATCDKKGCAPVSGAPATLASWNFNVSNGAWSFGTQAPPAATYYVEGDVSTTGSPNTQITLIAEGSIDIAGSADFTPHSTELLFVTDKDLRIRGLDTIVNQYVEGQMLVHGQIDIFGNVELAGQLIVEDTPGAGALVADGGNYIGGSVVIQYNGTLGSHMYSVNGWRDVRDLD